MLPDGSCSKQRKFGKYVLKERNVEMIADDVISLQVNDINLRDI